MIKDSMNVLTQASQTKPISLQAKPLNYLIKPTALIDSKIMIKLS